jgi:hypothetical protein
MDSRRTFLHPYGVPSHSGRRSAPVIGFRCRKAEPRVPPRRRRRALPPRKVRRGTAVRTVPQTDTGGWVEQTKVRGRNHVKELGKKAP